MTDDLDSEATEASSDHPDRKSLLERVAAELWRLNETQSTGELAALRRMRRYDVPPAAFYRLLARAGAYELGPDTVRRWARAVVIMAQRPEALKASGLGETMKIVGFSERRLDMLLYSRGPALHDLALRTAIRIAKSGERLPYRDLCHLVLYDGREDKVWAVDNVRIRVAQSYLRAGDKTAADGAAPVT